MDSCSFSTKEHCTIHFTDPILKCAIPVTVFIFCLHMVFILALKAWEDVRRRLDQGQNGGWTAFGILGLVTIVSIGYIFIIGGPTLKLPSTDSKKASAEAVALLDLTRLDQRSSSRSAFQCPEWADQIEIQFRVPVEEGYTYLSQIDHKEVAFIGFHPEVRIPGQAEH